MGRILIVSLIAGLALLFATCSKDVTEFNRQQIVGKWVPVDKEVMCGYQFSADGSCEKDIGFFEYADAAPCTFDRPAWADHEVKTTFVLPLNHTIRYYRSNSTYTIRKDSLLMIDPALKGWSRRRIRFLTADTLVMSGSDSSTPEYFVREKPVEINPEPLFDYIFIYCPPTGFSCEQYYSLSRNGWYVNCNRIFWLLQGAIRKADYEKLERLYQQADILDYLDSFGYEDAFAADEPAIVVSRNNRLYKLRNDLSNVPAEHARNYYQAYVSTLFYPDNLYFYPDVSIVHDNFRRHKFCTDDKTLELSEFSCFILTILAHYSPQSDQVFQSIYQHLKGKTEDL